MKLQHSLECLTFNDDWMRTRGQCVRAVKRSSIHSGRSRLAYGRDALPDEAAKEREDRDGIRGARLQFDASDEYHRYRATDEGHAGLIDPVLRQKTRMLTADRDWCVMCPWGAPICQYSQQRCALLEADLNKCNIFGLGNGSYDQKTETWAGYLFQQPWPKNYPASYDAGLEMSCKQPRSASRRVGIIMLLTRVSPV